MGAHVLAERPQIRHILSFFFKVNFFFILIPFIILLKMVRSSTIIIGIHFRGPFQKFMSL